MRRLKGLERAIEVSIVDPYMGEKGWQFSNAPGTAPDPFYDLAYLHQLYQKADPDYTGRATTPTLWDRERATIVSNESADVMRMLNDAFDAVADNPDVDTYPPGLAAAIDAANNEIYEAVNNGVYRAGFATTQAAYEEAFETLFDTLNRLDARLGQRRYLVGGVMTEADWRLFVTLVRFDVVYVGHFKCNRRRIADYRHLSGYLRELYQQPGIAETVDFDHIRHYYLSHPTINPIGIVPLDLALDLDAPHGRDIAGD